MKNTPRSLSIIECLVVLGLIAIMGAILFPVFAQAKVAAKKAVNLSNVKQFSTDLYLYSTDEYDTLDSSFSTLFNPYVKNSEIYCYSESSDWDRLLKDIERSIEQIISSVAKLAQDVANLSLRILRLQKRAFAKRLQFAPTALFTHRYQVGLNIV